MAPPLSLSTFNTNGTFSPICSLQSVAYFRMASSRSLATPFLRMMVSTNMLATNTCGEGSITESHIAVGAGSVPTMKATAFANCGVGHRCRIAARNIPA